MHAAFDQLGKSARVIRNPHGHDGSRDNSGFHACAMMELTS
jgi:hypothetical protein